MNRFQVARKLRKVGSQVDVSYMVYVNNDEPRKFDDKSSLRSFLSDYRSNNAIFKLQIYRLEIYSL